MNVFRTPKFNVECTDCELGCGNAIHSHCFSNFGKAKLFIISAYPGSQELKTQLTLSPYPNWTPQRKSINAGTYLDIQFKKLFDEDDRIPSELKPFYDVATVRGNAIRCSTRRGKDIIEVKDKHISACRSWLHEDLKQLQPSTPIMACGKEAVNILFGDRKHLLGDDKKIPSLFSLRRQIWLYKKHPVIITENPVQASNSLLSKVTKISTDNRGAKVVKQSEILIEPPLYSTAWHFNRDLQLAKDLVLYNLGISKSRLLDQIKGFSMYRKQVE